MPRLSDVYLESHCLAYARCMVKADRRVLHALKCKLNRESQWSKKMARSGSRTWHQTYTTATNVHNQSWSKIKSNVKEIVYKDRIQFWNEYISPLLQQGNLLKLLHLESCDLTWRSLIFDLPRGVLSFAVRSSIDFLPCLSNLRNWGKRVNDKCKMCGNIETLNHVLNSCQSSLNQGRFTWRHNSILSHLVKYFSDSDNDGTIIADLPGFSNGGGTIPPNIHVTNLKPDMLILRDNGRNITIVELTVPFETNIEKAHERKTLKYNQLVVDLKDKGLKCDLFCIEVGSRGIVTPVNERRLRDIFKINAQKCRTLKKNLSQLALLTSYTIWNARHNIVWDDCSLMN